MSKNRLLFLLVSAFLLFGSAAVAGSISAGSAARPDAFSPAIPLSHAAPAGATPAPPLEGPRPLAATAATPGEGGAALAAPMPMRSDPSRAPDEAPPAAMAPPFPAPTPDPRAMKLSAADSGAEIRLAGDQPLEIVLDANWSTGYRWEVVEADAGVLRLASQIQVPGAAGVIGAPGSERLTFQAVGPGDTALRLAYRRPWEKAEPAATFALQVSTRGPFLPFTPWAPPDVAVAAPLTGPAAAPDLPASHNSCQQGGGCLAIEDQGQCGSCWSMSATGAVENELNIFHKANVNGSTQYLVSCNTDGWGCQGGNPWQALNYYIDKKPPGEPAAGLVYEADAPYRAANLPCNGPYQHHEKIRSWSFVDPNTGIPAPALIKQAIYDRGPVVVVICAGPAMQSYQGGVFTTDESAQCGANVANHAVLLVGWDDSTQSWILRNSWGRSWGENGYMRIRWGVSNVGFGAAYVVDAGPQNTPTPSPSQLPNLAPYRPEGWDYPVVPSSTTGSTTVNTLYAGQPTYIDLAVGNSGATAAGPFDICLYLDNQQINSWHSNGLQSNYYTWAADWSYTVATPGQHTLKLVADCTHAVSEVSETDNIFERTFTWAGSATATPTPGSAGPNLVPYRPEGWDGPVVPANVTGGSTVTTLYAGQPTYIDLAVANVGAAAAGPYYVCLSLDNTEIGRWSSDGLANGYYNYVEDWSYTVAAPGQHTLKLVADCTAAVTESNESDNTYERTFTWISTQPTPTPSPTPTPLPGPLPDLAPYAPQGWSYPVVPANVTGGNTVTALYAGQPTYIDFAIGNYGTVDAGPFWACLYLDGAELGRWSAAGLQAGYYAGVLDAAFTIATGGDHTLRLVADCTNLVTESMEGNNAFERTFTWIGGGPPPTPTATAVVQLPTPTPPPNAALVKVSPAHQNVPLSSVDAGFDIAIENATGVGAYQVDLVYNPGIINVLEIKAGPFLGSTGRTVMPLSSIDNGAGLATFGANTIGSQPGAGGSGVLATIRIQSKARGSSPLQLQNLLLLKPNGDQLPGASQDGQVSVSNCFGDFNGDNVIDIRDLQAIASRWNCRAGDACYSALYDVYPLDQPDGKIDISDIQRVAAVWNTHCVGAAGPALVTEGRILAVPMAPVDLALRPGNPIVGVESEFELTLGVQNAYNLGGFQTDITFNPAQAQVVNATLGPFLGSTGRSVSPLGPVIDNMAGRVTLGGFTYGTDRAASGAGALAVIRLRATREGLLPVGLAEVGLTDALGNRVELGQVTGSLVRVGDVRQVYLPMLRR